MRYQVQLNETVHVTRWVEVDADDVEDAKRRAVSGGFNCELAVDDTTTLTCEASRVEPL